MRRVFIAGLVSFGLAMSSVQIASADCNCSLAVAGDVSAAIQAEIAKADGLYARGDYDAALAIYARVHGTSKDAVLLYAQGMAHLQLGARDKARAMFQAYLAAGANLAFRDRAEAQLGILGGATAAVSTGAGKVGGVLGGAAGDVGGTVGGVGGAVGGVGGAAVGGVDGTVNTGVGVAGNLKGNVDGKVKVGRKAGIVLGVIAVAALGAVLVHSIAAGVSDDISLDPKFDIGMGIAGVSVGISAIYVGGLTAATAAAGGAPCIGQSASNARPVGLAAGFRF